MTSTNIKKEDLEKVVVEVKKYNRSKMSKSEQDKNIADWQMFYLNNLDIFTEDFLQIPLHHFQRQILLNCWINDIMDIIASRGLSKSFTIGILAIDLALLLPGVNILITSMTLGQSNKIINEKIDILLSSEKKGISPILKQLRKDKYIQFKKDDTGDGRVVEIGNGSKIFAVCCGEGGRSNRSNIAITDEARLVKRRDYEAIIEPTLEPYNVNGLFLEPKQIFMTSARTKDNWIWTKLKKTVNNHYKSKDVRYGFFAGDIFTAVANKVQTKNQYKTRKENTNALDFDMEFLNLWLGETEGSLFTYDDFHKAQVLTKPFYPLSTLDYLEGCKLDYEFRDNDIRYMSVDIAVSGGRDDDNTVFTLGAIDLDNFKKRVEYIETKSGLNSMLQVVLMKRLFYEYKCQYIVVDTKGLGNVFFDILTVETEDKERGVTYPAWTVCVDKKLQISSENVINDKITRTISSNAEAVIIPIAGTGEINSQMHLSMMTRLKDETIEFLKDDSEMELILADKYKNWEMLSSEKKAEKLLPFMETRFMVNEAISLNTEIKEKTVKVKEERSATKDRYMSMAMFNLLGDKITNKLNGSQDYDDEEEGWEFLSGNYDSVEIGNIFC